MDDQDKKIPSFIVSYNKRLENMINNNKIFTKIEIAKT